MSASVRVYLKGDEEVRGLKGFVERYKKESGRDKECCLPGGIELCNKKGRWYVELDLTDPIPAAIVDIVDKITLKEFISFRTKREEGVYSYESAEGTISGSPSEIYIYKAKKMEDVFELYHKIRVGSIRPDESYEGQQGGMSRAELEAELERLRQYEPELERLRRREKEETRMNLEAKDLLQRLEGKWWPLCIRRRVWSEVYRITVPESQR